MLFLSNRIKIVLDLISSCVIMVVLIDKEHYIMGTRSLTKVFDEQGEQLLNFYRQFDGYPSGHGAELAEFLSGGKIVNGLRLGEEGTFFNGSGCLAAQLVANFKQESGGFYIYPVSAKDCGQDYEYEIYVNASNLKIKVFDCGCNFFGISNSDKHDGIFEGNLEEFTEFCKEKEEA